MQHLNVAMILAVLSLTCVGVHGQGYPDGRPSATLRMEAKDEGVVLKHGDGPGQCDYLGAREALIFEENSVYHLFYDGAGLQMLAGVSGDQQGSQDMGKERSDS